nr:nucleosome/chromatin assembly factor group C5 [Tanacetum cinerariifolium]
MVNTNSFLEVKWRERTNHKGHAQQQVEKQLDGVTSPVHKFVEPKPAVVCWCPDKSSVLGSSAEDGDANIRDYEIMNKYYNLNLDKIDLEHVQCPPKSKILTNIIKNHPLRFSIAASSSVPWIYMAQFWNTLKEYGSKYRLKFMLDKKELSLTPDDFRTIFHLPQANDNNHDRFVPPPSFFDMVSFYKNELGFTIELKTSLSFKTTSLLQPWQTLYKIFFKCLTTRVTGWDQPPLQIMQMMYWEIQRQSWNEDSSLDDLRSHEAHRALSDVCGVPTVDKEDDMILQDTLHVSLAKHKSKEEQEARENVELVNKHLAFMEIEKTMKGHENVIDDSSISRNDEHNIPDTRLEPMSDKESPEVEFTDVVIPMNVNEEEEEITDEELQGRYGYFFKHPSARFMPRKSFATLADHLQEVMADSLSTMVEKHVKEQVREQQVSQDIMEEVSLTIDKAKLKKIADEMLRQRCTSRDEHQYHIDQKKNFLKSDIVWESRKKILKGSSGPEKIVLSLHKFPTVIFNDDDIEERTFRWVNKCVKKFNPYARYGVKHWKNPHVKIFYIRKQKDPGKPKEIVARRAIECIVSITKPDFKNLNKNDIEDMYLLIMNGKACDCGPPSRDSRQEMLLSAILIHEVMYVLEFDAHAFTHFRDERKSRRSQTYSENFSWSRIERWWRPWNILLKEVIGKTPCAFLSLKAGMVGKGLRKRLWSIVEIAHLVLIFTKVQATSMWGNFRALFLPGTISATLLFYFCAEMVPVREGKCNESSPTGGRLHFRKGGD